MGRIVERISLGLNGEDANGVSTNAVMSGTNPVALDDGSYEHGRYIVFESTASNLVTGDTNDVADIFRYDTVTRETIRVSVGSDGGQSNSASSGGSISVDGRYVVFDTMADNLQSFDAAGRPTTDTNVLRDVYIRDLETGITSRVSERLTGDPSAGEATGGGSYNGTIVQAAGYTYVTFVSEATNLVVNDTNDNPDVLLKVVEDGTLFRVSNTDSGAQSMGSVGPYVATDYFTGPLILFSSNDPNITANDGSPGDSLFLTDGENVMLVSLQTNGAAQVGGEIVELSLVYPYVAYTTDFDETGLFGTSGNGAIRDVFVYNHQSQTLSLVSIDFGGGASGNGNSGYFPRVGIADDNTPYVTFGSDASNLIAGDTNGRTDFFLRNLTAGTTIRLSERAHGGDANGDSHGFATGGTNMSIRFAPNGWSFVFTSTATNLVDGDTNGFGDIFRVTLVEDPTVVASRGTTAAKEQVAKVIDATVMLADSDSAVVTNAKVAITGNFRAGQDVLQFTNTSAIKGSFNAATGVLTLTAVAGTPDIAVFEAALRTVKYLNMSNTPDTADRTITFTMDDNTAQSASADKTLSVAAVNDVPTDIKLVGTTVSEFRATNTVVGTLSAADPDGTAFTYSLTNNAGGRFAIAGNKLVVSNGVLLDYEQAKSHVVQIKVTDQGGLARVENFTIAVANVDPETVNGNAFANRILGGAKNDVLNGFGGADTLLGGIGNDTLRGGLGNDILQGGLGRDVLTGGENNDIFKFVALTDSRGATMDIITDFDDPGKGDDRIDLSAIYGGTLAYIHGAGFSKAGQVRINDIAGADVIVEVYAGGTLGVDFSIRLAGTTLASMTKSDFVL